MTFDLGTNGTSNFNNVPAHNECSNEAARDKLMSMNDNRKAISSDDLFTDMQQSAEMKERFAQLAGAQQISSDMLFGSPDKMQPSFGQQTENYLMGRDS